MDGPDHVLSLMLGCKRFALHDEEEEEEGGGQDSAVERRW